ncbi:MAG TPA: dienelactone hydrolase family protein [Solirubrobacteraceae bacterium]|jgi:carboxymethylenebutenolidase
MSASMIDVATRDGSADAYLSTPDDGERHPGVLLIMDAFGLRSQIEGMADRIAERGFAVLAPNVFYRDARSPIIPPEELADPEHRGALFERIGPMMRELTPERIASDGAAYLDKLEEVGRGPVAITGYCMGARLGWRIATAYPQRVAALAGFHGGGLVTDDPDSPHLSAGELTAELYLGHADNDPSMSPEQIAILERALTEAGVTYISEVFKDAAHGYTMADTPAYQQEGAERHFRELFALLERTLGVASRAG